MVIPQVLCAPSPPCKMKCSSPLVLLLSLLLCAQALRLPQLPSRRAAIGAIGSAILLPVSAQVREAPFCTPLHLICSTDVDMNCDAASG